MGPIRTRFLRALDSVRILLTLVGKGTDCWRHGARSVDGPAEQVASTAPEAWASRTSMAWFILIG